MARLCLILFCILFFLSCKNEDRDKPEQRVEEAQAITTEDSSSIYSEAFSQWLDSTLHLNKNTRTHFTIEERWVDDSLKALPFNFNREFIATYHSVLRWSPDSLSVLDLGSYGLLPVIKANGEIKLEGEEPDTEVALINVKNQERTRLLFVGPAAEIKDGRWMSNSEAVILGSFTVKEQTDTLLWMIDLQEKLFRLYNIKTSAK